MDRLAPDKKNTHLKKTKAMEMKKQTNKKENGTAATGSPCTNFGIDIA